MMGRQLIKVDPDVDLYIEWSSIVEDAMWVGSRAELAAYLNEPRRGEHWQTEAETEQRITRADEHGSSAFRPFGCTWDDSGEMYRQEGVLPRARMREAARRWLEDEQADISDLLEPLEQ